MRVVVAMSGGVDSAVSAGLLAEQGHEVIGVHMRLHDRGATNAPGHCCGVDDALDARRVADQLGFPFYVFDLREAFGTAVMADFAEAYLAGRTPNPCVQCNGVLKFRVLLARALELGAEALATGHYARNVDGELRIAADSDKDQTYFLFPVTPAALARTVFPLGGLTKGEVRAHAERLGLPVASKPESQEVCFLPTDDHTAFVAEHATTDPSGEIVDEAGAVLGRHDAYFRFTVGQRRGLNVALGEPAYVLRVEPATRRVVVTTDPARLGAMGLRASRGVWHARPEPGESVGVRVRHRGRINPATVDIADDGSFTARFDEPVRAVAPGQAAVVYRGERVLGGGWIGGAT
ncbi:MAG: tRNA 2-thiouridine(34) synthase MnmA [Myxococcota bacterium]